MDLLLRPFMDPILSLNFHKGIQTLFYRRYRSVMDTLTQKQVYHAVQNRGDHIEAHAGSVLSRGEQCCYRTVELKKDTTLAEDARFMHGSPSTS